MARWRLARFLTQAAIFCGLLASAAPSARAQGAAGIREFEGQRAPDISRKLSAIILPSVEFHSTTLGDAIEFLRQQSRRLDSDPDPASRGINIILKLPEPGGAAGTSTAATKIRVTLTLRNIPLIEALRYVATQAELQVKVEPYAVSLLPLTQDSKPLVTAVFSVPPGFFGSAAEIAGPSALGQPATPAH